PAGARVKPGCGVAKALAAVFAPETGAPAYVGSAQAVLAPFRRPAQFPGRARQPLRRHLPFKLQAQRIAQPEPDEVKQFVHEDTGKLGRGASEPHGALADERAGMHRAMAVAQPALGDDAHRSTL